MGSDLGEQAQPQQVALGRSSQSAPLARTWAGWGGMAGMVAGWLLLLLLLVGGVIGGFASQRTMLVLFRRYSRCYSCAMLALFLRDSCVVLA